MAEIVLVIHLLKLVGLIAVLYVSLAESFKGFRRRLDLTMSIKEEDGPESKWWEEGWGLGEVGGGWLQSNPELG